MSILTKAEEIINGQRAKDYGDAKENHERIAALWNVYAGTDLKPDDVAVMMILLKIARFMENGYHQDTVVDIAGYAGVLEKMQLPKEERYKSAPATTDRITAEHRGKKWVDKDGYVFVHIGQGRWSASKDEWVHTYNEPFGDDYWKLTEVV